MGGGRLKHARYQIIEDLPGKPLLINDLGPWDEHLSVTNDAENVAAELIQHDGRFLGFAPGPRGARRA